MRLGRDEIALWTLDLAGCAAPECLSPEERARADATLAPEPRRRRIGARVALRRVLGGYLGVAPAEVPILTDPLGKPRLERGPAFNLSHSEDVMLLAVGDAAAIGVDLDLRGRLDGDWRGVARTAFSEDEQRQLEAMPEGARAEAAVRCWVRKEAYAKARGAGFAYGFKSFTVRTAEAGAGSLLIEDLQDPGATGAWRLRDIDAPSSFVASLAHSRDAARIQHRQLSELNP
ncbi:4'-phosphopantetheinyl transferase superfamily protein [Phenylobacterium sp. LjRoot219]|uniref:4'-phosphopantetheinyl transferase family protein n=1 Tax=Phenylobacterium sp. LjRoot219 TaxID=3342283 RepID=UPI003ECCD3FC